MMNRNLETVWRANSVNPLRARLTADIGTGQPTGPAGEGNWLKQADLDSITFYVTDETSGSVVLNDQTVALSCVLDSPVTSPLNWKEDRTGHNFLHRLPVGCFPTIGHTYTVRYHVVSADDEVYEFAFTGPAI